MLSVGLVELFCIPKALSSFTEDFFSRDKFLGGISFLTTQLQLTLRMFLPRKHCVVEVEGKKKHALSSPTPATAQQAHSHVREDPKIPSIIISDQKSWMSSRQFVQHREIQTTFHITKEKVSKYIPHGQR